MKGCILVLFLFSLLGLTGQVPPMSFVYGYTGEESFVFFEQLGDEFLFVGNSSSSSEGLSDVFLLRTTTALEVINLTVLGYFNAEEAVGALIYGSDLFILVNRLSFETGYDPVLIRTDLDGNVISETNLGGPGWEFGNRLRLGNDELLIVGSWGVEGDSEASTFCAKLDLEATVQLFSTFPPTDFGKGNDVATWQDGYLVAGSISVEDTFDYRPALLHLNSNLAPVETFSVGDEPGEFKCIKIGNQGVVLGGWSSIDGTGEHLLFCKLDDVLSPVWIENVAPEGAVVDLRMEDDRFVFLGNTAFFSFNGNNDTYLFQTNFDGVFAGSRLYGGAASDQCQGLFIDSEANSVICGETSSFDGPDHQAYAVFIPSIVPGTNENNEGQIITHSDETLDLEESELNTESSVVIFPNPVVNGSFYLNADCYEVHIRSIVGGPVGNRFRVIGGQVEVLDLPKGCYIVSGKLSSGKWFNEKIVVF